MDPASLCLLLASEESIPVIDIDGTFFIQGGLYLLLVVVLHPLLFKPWLEALARRTEAIDGALAKSKQLRTDADQLLADYEKGLDAARDKAMEERASKRHVVEAEQAEMLAETRANALAQLDSDRTRLAEQAEAAKGDLAGKVDELATEIAGKLLGRAS